MASTDRPVYLRPDVVAEPLIARWYAWVQLVSPVTAALNVVRRHVPVMTSFAASPMLHVAAAELPEMLGGQFVAHGPERVDEVKALIEWTRREQKELFDLAAAVDDLHALLRSRAAGMALETLYASIPEPLRGLVELEYDLHGRPSFRLLEALVYRSRFYQPRWQGLSLQRSAGDSRRFMLSTPRLHDPGVLHVDVPFADEAVDTLFAGRALPVRRGELGERLGVSGEAALDLWGGLFTTDPPPAPAPFLDPGVRVRYFGHATLLVETADVAVLVDPVVSHASAAPPERFTFADLPARIDHVLITHHHQDHVQIETLLQLRHRIGTVVVGQCAPGALQDPSLKLMLRALGFPRVVELGELEAIEIPGGSILGLPFIGEHHDLAIRSRLGYRIDLAGRSMAALVDSCNLEPEVYRRVRAVTGPVDALFLGMECVGSPLSWSYGPLLPERPQRVHDQSRRGRGSNFVEGRALVEALEPSSLYVYAMGEEPWLRHILGLAHGPGSTQISESDRLVAWCRERGLESERLYGKREMRLARRGGDA